MWENLFVVITTINEISAGILKLLELSEELNFKIILVGDRKTPDITESKNLTYLSLERQKELYPKFADLIPYNHYCRKNIGYLYSMHNGAEFIFDTDDDNIPYDNFEEIFNIYNSKKLIYENSNKEAVNVYKYFSNEHIWPRGLPLNLIHNFNPKNLNKYNLENDYERLPVVQFLADKDPDVDAIYRLQFKNEIVFEKRDLSLILGKNMFCPFNSQATLFHKSVFSFLYLPSYVPFRMTDIWRSFVIQGIAHNSNFFIGFSNAIVYQDRNSHDLLKDFKDEIEGYLNNEEIINRCNKFEWESCPNLSSMYKYILSCTDSFELKELDIINEWSNLCETI